MIRKVIEKVSKYSRWN